MYFVLSLLFGTYSTQVLPFAQAPRNHTSPVCSNYGNSEWLIQGLLDGQEVLRRLGLNRSYEAGATHKALGSKENPVLFFILAIVLGMALFGSLPTWPRSPDWKCYPGSGVSLVLLVLLILFLIGRL
jgi:hypothetical protein